MASAISADDTWFWDSHRFGRMGVFSPEKMPPRPHDFDLASQAASTFAIKIPEGKDGGGRGECVARSTCAGS